MCKSWLLAADMEPSYHDFDCLKDCWPFSGDIKLSGNVRTTERILRVVGRVEGSAAGGCLQAVVTGRWNRLTAMCFQRILVQHKAPLPLKTHPFVATDRCRAAALGGCPIGRLEGHTCQQRKKQEYQLHKFQSQQIHGNTCRSGKTAVAKIFSSGCPSCSVETRGTATGPKGPQVKTTLNPHSTKCGLFSLRCSQLLELRSS